MSRTGTGEIGRRGNSPGVAAEFKDHNADDR
jgi:hypothetical protein